MPYVAKKIEEGVRERRQTTRETLEMMVYIDRATVNYHGSANVDTYVMNMLNIVRRFGKIKTHTIPQL